MFKSDVSVLVKIQAFLHLTHYMVHPMMLLVVLTSIPMLYTQWFFNHLAHAVMIYTLLCLATFGPTSMYLFLSKYLVSPFLMICTAGFFSVFFLSIKQSFAKTRNPKKV